MNEFYFSKNNNIKLAIASLQSAEVLNPSYKLAFNHSDDEILKTTHFINRNFRDFEYTAFNLEKKKYQELDTFIPFPIYKFTSFLENHHEFILDNKLVNSRTKLECSDIIVYKFINFSKNLLNEEDFLTSHGIINKDFKLLNFLNKNKLL